MGAARGVQEHSRRECQGRLVGVDGDRAAGSEQRQELRAGDDLVVHPRACDRHLGAGIEQYSGRGQLQAVGLEQGRGTRDQGDRAPRSLDRAIVEDPSSFQVDLAAGTRIQRRTCRQNDLTLSADRQLSDAAGSQQLRSHPGDHLRRKRIVTQVEGPAGGTGQGIQREPVLEHHGLQGFGLAGGILDGRKIAEQERAPERNLVGHARLVRRDDRRRQPL